MGYHARMEPKRRRARAARDKEELRAALLAAGPDIFSARGYAGTRVEELAAAAGLSPGAFYTYFESKLGFYRQLCLLALGRLEARLAAADDPEAAAPARLRALGLAYLRFGLEEPSLYRLVGILHLGEPEFFGSLELVAELEAGALRLLDRVAGLIQAGLETGLLRLPGDAAVGRAAVRACAAALWAGVDGILVQEAKGAAVYLDSTAEERGEALLELLLRGLASEALRDPGR